jgi:hypothetical protein
MSLGIPDLVNVPALIDLPGTAFAQGVVVRVALAEIQLGFVCFLVAAAVTAIYAAERGGRPGLGGFVLLWRRLPDLVLARSLAILVVAGLSLTVVGLPFALRQALRWAFLEQAILIDGRSALGALADGRTLLAGAWRRTIVLLLLLSVIALVFAPALGAGLLLWTDVSLTYVNLATAVAYALIVPYVACVLAVTYQDLQARQLRS